MADNFEWQELSLPVTTIHHCFDYDNTLSVILWVLIHHTETFKGTEKKEHQQPFQSQLINSIHTYNQIWDCKQMKR